MKKIVTLILTGLMLIGALTMASAESLSFSEQQSIAKGLACTLCSCAKPMKMDSLKDMLATKELAEEVHEINALRMERNDFKNKLIEKQDKLYDILVDVNETQDKEHLSKLQEKHELLKEINSEHKAVNRKLFNKKIIKSLKKGDIKATKDKLAEIIIYYKASNKLIARKIEVIDSMLEI